MDRAELRRYSRQILLPEIALVGQERLKASSVLIVGLGGLGSPVAQYLAGAGIGRIGLSEFDALEVHNLQRQTLYETGGVGQPKLDLAMARLHAINPGLRLEPQPKLSPGTAHDVIKGYDLIVDATDNFEARYLVSDVCVELDQPWVWGGAVRWEGMASVFDARLSLRDVFADPPAQTEDCDTLGVHGPLLGVVGSVMASQAIKRLVGLETLYGRLWMFDALTTTARIVKLKIRS